MSPLKRNETVNPILKLLGFSFLAIGVLIFVKTYYSVIKAELVYQVTKPTPKNTDIIPVDSKFSIIIPKIKVNAKVIKNVDPYNSAIYQKALTQGVAHAKGSGLPGFPGNTFIFAHSAINWYQANQYNAIFYLTNKLETGDEIIMYYEGSKFLYTVTEKKIVKGTDINYLSNNLYTKTLTLMTCWPPGTNLNRLIIIAKAP